MEFNRRDFNRLTAAAMGGMLAGAAAGCSNDQPAQPNQLGANGNTATPDEPATASAAKHACRGLNACKNQGKGGKNECAGQGLCATAAEHACGGLNECKHQGGCGEKPGLNECKGHGGCHVPMTGSMWASARKAFEEKMKADGKSFGAAPAEAGK